MSQELRSVCCCTEEPAATCESGDGCEAHLAGFQRGCCEASLQPVRVIAALPNATAPDPASPQLPVLGIPVSDYLALQASHAVVVAPVDWSGRTIYLTTGRLQIETIPPVVPLG